MILIVDLLIAIEWFEPTLAKYEASSLEMSVGLSYVIFPISSLSIAQDLFFSLPSV